MKTSIKFPSEPPMGTRFAIQEQEYVLYDSEPYTRADGSSTILLVWQSHCASCGDEFFISTPLGFTTGQSRRCEKHREPGKKVRKVAAPKRRF